MKLLKDTPVYNDFINIYCCLKYINKLLFFDDFHIPNELITLIMYTYLQCIVYNIKVLSNHHNSSILINNYLYLCGLNEKGSFGLGDINTYLKYFVQSNHRVLKFHSNYFSSFILTSNG